MKIVPVFLRYDYGIKSRGDSLEYNGFYPALKQITDRVYPFWFDEYLTKKDELQKRVIKFIDDVSPDVVFFILMKDEFSFETLDYLKSKYITVNWFCDDQWRFENFTKHYAPHFSYAVTTDKFSLSKYKKIDYKNVIPSQSASSGIAKGFDPRNVKYKYDVSFVGVKTPYREWVVRFLKKKSIHVECFGSEWPNGRISYEEMCDVFRISKINLNLSNSTSHDIRYMISSIKALKEFLLSRKRFEQIKARNFEIPAFGGFQLTNYVAGLGDYFRIGKDIAVYSVIDDLPKIIRYYLQDEKTRVKMLKSGYAKAKREHIYYHRLKQILKEIG